jgi:transcriptional regulator with XRE-family HTH domain
MSAFVERLVEAAKHAGIEPTQAGIAESLGLSKQTVWRWFREGIEPNAENCFEISHKWGVDAEWLKSGDGEMFPKLAAELPQDERDLLKDYRLAAPKVRKIIRGMARAARKSIVTIVATIPPLLAPSPTDAGVLHKNNCDFGLAKIHIACRRWLRYMMSFGERAVMIS